MKTFSEYISEAVDFRLGGSSNKGEIKTFANLKKGDVFYRYNVESDSMTKKKLVFEEYVSHDGRFAIRFGIFGSSGFTTGERCPDVLHGEDCSIFATLYVNKLGVELFSIEELKDSEAWNIAQKMKRNELRDKDVAIYESVDFRLGGSKNKGDDAEVIKTFEELEKGDVIYLWNFDGNNDIELKEPRTIISTQKTNHRFELEVEYPNGNIAIVSVPMHRIKYATHGWLADGVCAFTTYDMDKDELLAAIKEERRI